ncbi:MAG: hypothetical protein DRG27_03145 [Deltaproteobacteria bacterium]|nr:MAG: hypothetical protein DRG27_03145 [Deltaproteobacteria bacterium]
MVKRLNLKYVILTIKYAISSKDLTKDSVVEYLIYISNMDKDTAVRWIDLFVSAICKVALHDVDFDFAFSWVKKQASFGMSPEYIASLLTSNICNLMLASDPSITRVDVILDGSVIQKFERTSEINLAEPPKSGTVKLHFSKFNVNEVNKERVVVFVLNDGKWTYQIDFADMPDKFKYLYVLYLRLLGKQVPDDLSDYVADAIQIDDFSIEVDLSKAVLVEW